MSRSQGETGGGTARNSVICQPIPEQALHHFSVGKAPGAMASTASSFFTSVAIIVHRACQCGECLGLLGAMHHFPSPAPPSHPESKTKLNETQRLLEHRTPVLITGVSALKDTFRPSSWCVSQFIHDLVLHPGSLEAVNAQIHKRLRACLQNSASNDEPHLASRCAPKATTAVAHGPFLLRRNPTHRTIPPRTAGVTPLFWLPSLSTTTFDWPVQLLTQIQLPVNIATTNRANSNKEPKDPAAQTQPREDCPPGLHTSRPGSVPFAHDANSDNSRSPTEASAVNETNEAVWSMRLSRVFDPK